MITWFHVSLLANAEINLKTTRNTQQLPSDALYWREDEACKQEHLSQNLPISTTEKFRAAQSNY